MAIQQSNTTHGPADSEERTCSDSRREDDLLASDSPYETEHSAHMDFRITNLEPQQRQLKSKTTIAEMQEAQQILDGCASSSRTLNNYAAPRIAAKERGRPKKDPQDVLNTGAGTSTSDAIVVPQDAAKKRGRPKKDSSVPSGALGSKKRKEDSQADVQSAPSPPSFKMPRMFLPPHLVDLSQTVLPIERPPPASSTETVNPLTRSFAPSATQHAKYPMAPGQSIPVATLRALRAGSSLLTTTEARRSASYQDLRRATPTQASSQIEVVDLT